MRRSDFLAEILIVRAEASELPRACDWADAMGREFALPQSTLFAIQLCFEEALSNIVQHGFADSQDKFPSNKEIRLTLERKDDTIIATIEDHGMPFDPRGHPAPVMVTEISEAPLGGRGIHLMRKFARCLDYERRNGVNRLTLCFHYGGPTIADG
jgi:anti-sigma regulatory factor (Ser/Thr protein kinase)